MEGTASRLEWLTFQRLVTALLFLAIGLGACFAPAQNDTWWQLRTGQDIWNTRSIDLSDHFSHTASGAYWPNHEWLSQVLFYAIYRIGGPPPGTATITRLFVSSWLGISRRSPRRKGPRAVTFASPPVAS